MVNAGRLNNHKIRVRLKEYIFHSTHQFHKFRNTKSYFSEILETRTIISSPIFDNFYIVISMISQTLETLYHISKITGFFLIFQHHSVFTCTSIYSHVLKILNCNFKSISYHFIRISNPFQNENFNI